MKTILAAVRSLEVRDWWLYTGLALLGSGASLVFAPAGMIAAGACLVAIAVFGVAPTKHEED